MIPNTIEKTPEGGLPAANCSLFLGDCLEMMKHIPDGSVDMVMCDLPYGTTACKWDSVIPLDALWAEYKRVCKPSAAIVLTTMQPFTSHLCLSNLDAFKYELIWHKTRNSHPFFANKRPLPQHENVLVFCCGQHTYNPQKIKSEKPHKIQVAIGRTKGDEGGRKWEGETKTSNERFPNSVLQISNPSLEAGLHPTQKPVALMEYLIRTYTHAGETVLDNTMGSGTTGVACVNTGRRFIGIERDAEYFRVASERISSANANVES
jgi:site-specific DNA-methyltransferase (adenine-specific)